MNLNNLEDLQTTLKDLGFPKKLAEDMEKNMNLPLPEFNLKHQVKGENSPVDINLTFKKSGKSDNYYLNKYEVALSSGKPLEEGKKYIVISKGDGNQPLFRKFDATHEAIQYFKDQTGTSELAIGKDIKDKQSVAKMEDGKVNYVAKEFRNTFYTPPKTQNIYIKEGTGFSAEQSANLIQGRSVYRPDMLSTSGQEYKAWVNLDFDKPKDSYGNFKTKQFNEAYGFEVKEVLGRYQIQELSDPKKLEKLEESLKNGNRAEITTKLNGQDIKLRIEAIPRYNQINFYRENGKPEKREQFMTPVALEELQNKKAGKEKGIEQGQEMTR